MGMDSLLAGWRDAGIYQRKALNILHLNGMPFFTYGIKQRGRHAVWRGNSAVHGHPEFLLERSIFRKLVNRENFRGCGGIYPADPYLVNGRHLQCLPIELLEFF